MRCSGCQVAFGEDERPAASFSIEIFGDETTFSYWRCRSCGCYTQETLRDSFTTGEHESLSGPIAAERGQEILAEIARCPEPYNKRCDCDVHRNW
jgi:hypothetical protein